MPLPKIEAPEQVVLMDGAPARRLVRVVKVHKDDPTVVNRLVEIASTEKAKAEAETK